ncbi:hypothetical protein E2C01_080119 [Portunus trituberculatus]|uniref:Uncharacterized protein n=1 Tax=Portunus trituberculatus TaxID=210409 RepID=A0A5B7IT70_PORTR|nr:hypothetical protein [Portunus trituberculatus]
MNVYRTVRASFRREEGVGVIRVLGNGRSCWVMLTTREYGGPSAGRMISRHAR